MLRQPVASFVLCIACASCATPVQRIENFAQARHMTRTEIATGPSNAVVFFNDPARLLRTSVSGNLATLHIYLEDDAAEQNTEAATVDPTPRDVLALRLMARDDQPSVYITRPCAHGNAGAPGCSAALWSHARYGVAVLERMTQAIRRVSADAGKPNVVLIGYGGGGVLAMLLAARVDQVIGVMTVAAPLDPDAWARGRGADVPSASLNPVRAAALPNRVVQYHAAGGRDERVPPPLIAAAVATQPGATFEVFESYDHVCCWEERWPELLAQFNARLHR